MQQPSGDPAPSANILRTLTQDRLEPLTEFFYEDILDEAILGLGFEVHRATKLGIFFLDEPKEDEKKYEIVDEIGLDVFGQVPLKKQFDCVCPNCQRNLAASRFAPHLEKCMGMGRNSSRIASKRIANTGKVESDVDDYDNDSDWGTDKKLSKKKRDKCSPRRTKFKGKNEERKALLMQMCGVISEHTKKMCTRSHRCPQHTDEQRKAVRLSLLGSQQGFSDSLDDVQVDVDTFEDNDSQSLRDFVSRHWESSNSANVSPADSASTASSSSTVSKKKDWKQPVATASGRSNGNHKKTKLKVLHSEGI